MLILNFYELAEAFVFIHRNQMREDVIYFVGWMNLNI